MLYAHQKHLNRGFSLLELLVVAAIITVLAAFTIPGFLNYVVQTRVNALWQQADAAKLQVASMYLKRDMPVNTINVNSGAAEYTTANVDFVKCITIQNGIVSVVGNPAKFSNKNIWIAWEPTVAGTALNWSCKFSADAAEYVTEVGNTCAAQACQEFSSWGTPTTINTETFFYSGTLSQAEVSSAFANNCNTSASMSGCAACYNFVNNDTEQRFMDFTVSNVSYNYQGALGADPNWSSYSSWAYQYNYTQVVQACKAQTRTSNSCANVNPFANDPACN